MNRYFGNYSKHLWSIWSVIIVLSLIKLSSQVCNVQSCSSCYTGYSNACLYCAGGFYNTGYSCCSNSKTYCSTCFANSYACDACVNNLYYLLGGACYSCPASLPHCSTCASNIKCLSCSSNDYAVNTVNQCQTCISLMNHCTNCTSSTVCIKCDSDIWVPSTITFQCVHCDQFLTDCTNCNSTTVCTKCKPDPNIALDPISHTCASCPLLMSHCLNCTSSTTCTFCQTMFTVSPIAGINCIMCASVMIACLECSSYSTCTKCSIGKIVESGCSQIPGCVKVYQNIPGRVSPCTRCNTIDFISTPVNSTCQCRQGHLAGQYCTQIIGCTNILRNSTGDYCMSCSAMDHFILQNGICICKSSYYLIGKTCNQICGDGIVIDLPCDDGNLINGDGCSSTCQMEYYYYCKALFKQPSKCIYEGPVSLKLVSMEKVIDQNRIKVTITTDPQIDNFQKMNITNKLNFSSLALCTITQTNIIGPYLYLNIDYLEDMDTKHGSYTVTFDNDVINSRPSTIQLNFNQGQQGNSFIYDPQSASNRKLIRAIISSISLTMLVIFFIGSYAHRMIGIQTIHTFQLSFIALGFSQLFQPIVVNFQNLSISMGLNSFFSTSGQAAVQNYYKNLTFKTDLLNNMLFQAFIQIMVLIFFLVVIAILNHLSKRQNKDQKNCVNTFEGFLKKLKLIYYDFLIFPIFIGFCFNTVLSLSSQCRVSFTKSFASMTLQSATILIIILPTFMILFNQLKATFFPITATKYITIKINYIPLYMSYTFLISLLLVLQLFKIIRFPIFINVGIMFICCTVIALYRPYISMLHNICLLVNQSVILFCYMWICLQKIITLTKKYQQIFMYCLIGQLILVLILAIVRILYEFRQKYLNSLIKPKKKKKKKHERTYQDYQNELKLAIHKQQSQGINSYRMTAQQLRNCQLNYQQINSKRIQNRLHELDYQNQKKKLKQYLLNRIVHNLNTNYQSNQQESQY